MLRKDFLYNAIGITRVIRRWQVNDAHRFIHIEEMGFHKFMHVKYTIYAVHPINLNQRVNGEKKLQQQQQ